MAIVRTARLIGAILSLAQAASALSQSPTPSPDITVTGRRAPTAEAPKSSTCEALVRNPFVRAQISAIQSAGGTAPILLPTRMPRSPDYSAPPTVLPGSPLPELGKGRFGGGPVYAEEGPAVQFEDVTSLLAETNADHQFSPGETNAQTSEDVAISACRTAYSRGSAVDSAGRATIAANDRTLPMAFALFDQGRYAEALPYFQQAERKLPFESGGDEAMLFIGKIYLQGLGSKSDPEKGVDWLKRAATSPFNPASMTPLFDPLTPQMNTAVGEAAVMLGNIYAQGFGPIPRDPAQARRWFSRAYEVGHIAAAEVVGDFHAEGAGTARDPKQAASWYRKAAQFGLTSSQVKLADMLYDGDGAVAKDRKQAYGWYKAAATMRDPDGLYALARGYDLGEDTAPDPERALALYRDAALRGSAPAQVAIGTYFYEGRQVAKDDKTARQWFQAAAGRGDADGMFNLGVMMARGEGGPKDLPAAWALLRRSGQLGHANATRALGSIEAMMTPAEREAIAPLKSGA